MFCCQVILIISIQEYRQTMLSIINGTHEGHLKALLFKLDKLFCQQVLMFKVEDNEKREFLCALLKQHYSNFMEKDRALIGRRKLGWLVSNLKLICRGDKRMFVKVSFICQTVYRTQSLNSLHINSPGSTSKKINLFRIYKFK